MNLLVQGLAVATKEIIKRKALEGLIMGVTSGASSILAAHMMKKVLMLEKAKVQQEQVAANNK